jgi:4-hydroxybenzoate polyprenyltransferase
VSIKMVKIILVLSSFVMILLNKSTYRVKLDLISILFFALLFVCVYYEVYQDNRRKAHP